MKIYILIIVIVIIFFAIQSYSSRKKAKEFLKNKIHQQWGSIPKREYTYEEFEKITHYFNTKIKENHDKEFIDDITWSDLDMDTVFMQLNTTMSSVGEDYLYYLLRTPVKSSEELEERDRLIEFFSSHKETAFQLEELYAGLGRTRRISIHDYIFRLKDLGKRSNIKHYTLIVLLLASVALLAYNPPISIILIIVMVAVNIINYMKIKSEIDAYFDCFRYLVKIIVSAEAIMQLDIKELEEYNQILRSNCRKVSSFKRGVSLLAGNNMTGSISDIIMDYVRMLFHVDLIKFNNMLSKVNRNINEIDTIFETLGRIESMIAIASYRQSKTYFCKPVLNNSSVHMYFEEIYHPLIENPVVNDLNVNKGVLLTGSNASGKSTFLKTVGINAILAQTIYTCLAKQYNSNFYSIYSSMALKDDLENNESYYIVEIKSLKRILDNVKSGKQILCLIDEVLRGTNTVERIAASAHVLKSLSADNVMCFAATHDIELTHLLEDYYCNYHFQEEVLENDIKFNYQLYKGRATSRNAIKLLSIIGYDNKIIEQAEKSANRFINEGVWALENK